MIVAVDFDDTLSFAEYPGISLDLVAVNIMRQAKKNGHQLILWTCRHDEPLDMAVLACTQNGLQFDAINENEPEQQRLWMERTGEKNFSPKVYADIYIDDKARFDKTIPWQEIDTELNGAPDKNLSCRLHEWFHCFIAEYGWDLFYRFIHTHANIKDISVRNEEVQPFLLRAFNSYISFQLNQSLQWWIPST